MTGPEFDIAMRILCGLFAAAVLVYIFSPGRNTETGADKTRVVYLYERKEVVYENLRDLNFEFKSGKFTQADYDGMRLGMEAEAARILAEIDKLESAQA
ncbi:MAG TPA: hypothetical protein VN176_04360 [Verrucomicrobiae bacterium]|nr:hypothetical protein [Verrucomicrobiae bacterium]